MFAGGGGGYIRFLNGRFQYIVYSAVGKDWGTKDGVAVERDGKLIRNFRCHNVPESKLGEEFFISAGLAVDPEEFSIP